jgi:hypothetical protein
MTGQGTISTSCLAKLLIVCFLLAGASSVARAQSINAASCNALDVQAAFNQVTASTTTVSIPAGKCTWTTAVTLKVPVANLNLSVIGAGNLSTVGGGDGTVITDSYVSSQPLLSLETGTPASFLRFAGITLQGGNAGGTADTKFGGIVQISGASQNFRLDHCHFNTTTYTAAPIEAAGMRIVSQVYGVVDHNLFDGAGEKVQVYFYTYGGSSWGDGAWNDVTAFGSSSFIFVENNTVNGTGDAMDDCKQGGKLVIRYNTLNSSWVLEHGLGQGTTRERGCRALEVYNNAFNAPATPLIFDTFFLSGGPAMIYNNSAPQGYQVFAWLPNIRDDSGHQEPAPPASFGFCGNAIDSQTTDSPWDQNTDATSGYACLDQPGRGQGDLLANNFPNATNVTLGSATWPRQKLEPIYEWLDTWTAPPDYNTDPFQTLTPLQVQANRDWFQYNSSFNGTSGTGAGLFAARPATCTSNSVSYPAGNSPGVGYWATDQNTLYVCTATNTWTAYYTPFTYPHPLISSQPSSSAPAAPTGLTANVH